MADVVSPEVRSRMMSGIRAKDTGPELLLRGGLHRLGFRFRLYAKDLPGKPDIVLPRWRAVIFFNGCFWHGHKCLLFKLPRTRTDFWREKIDGNRERDVRHIEALRALGWRVAVIRECSLRGRLKNPPENVLRSLAGWLRGDDPILELPPVDLTA